MGCGQVNTKKVIISNQDGFWFNVYVWNHVKEVNEKFTYKSLHDRLSLPVLMNYLCFNIEQDKKLDGNFISVYDREKDNFTYWVQRLDGISIPDDNNPSLGKKWIVYLNENKKLTWNEIVKEDFMVSHNDKIVWVFQNETEDLSRTNFRFDN